MDEAEVKQNNMLSNLPLLIVNGYPASIDKVTVRQLEAFIPFMVQCSLGQISVLGKNGRLEPNWWPEDIPFSMPLTKPKNFAGNWSDKLKEIVVVCYQFHDSIYLLRFCNELASYEPARLRFINNLNATTSIFDRRNNKLLVTFRNENMTYDQPQTNKKCLLQRKRRSKGVQLQQMVEPPLFDIYLCDNCDAELYSLEAITEHEKTCTPDDDEVIICDSPIPETSPVQFAIDLCENSNDELRENFLLNFNLKSREPTSSSSSVPKLISNTTTKTKDTTNVSLVKNTVKLKDRNNTTTATNPSSSSNSRSPPIEKIKRLPRRNRSVYALSRCPAIPLSSPAGQLMIKNSRTIMSEEYLYERLDRMERFCHAPVLKYCVHRPKFLDKKYMFPHVQCTFKKPANFPLHTYVYPRRQFSNKYRMECFYFFNSILLKRCRPVSIQLKRLTEAYIKKRSQRRIELKPLSNNVSKTSTPRPLLQVVDTINLCSSDEEDDTNNSSVRLHLNQNVTLTPIAKINNSVGGSGGGGAGANGNRNYSDIRKTNKYEANFLLSQSIINNQPKPLQPSVFLFSNYTAESIHFHRFSTNNISNNNNNNATQITDRNNYQNNNQENLENNTKKSEDWSTTNNNNGRTDRNSTSNNSKVLQIMSYLESSEVTINKISSPNRTISIDLTS